MWSEGSSLEPVVLWSARGNRSLLVSVPRFRRQSLGVEWLQHNSTAGTWMSSDCVFFDKARTYNLWPRSQAALRFEIKQVREAACDVSSWRHLTSPKVSINSEDSKSYHETKCYIKSHKWWKSKESDCETLWGQEIWVLYLLASVSFSSNIGTNF